MVFNRSNGIYRSIFVALGGLAIVASALFLLIRDLSTVDSAYSHSAANAAVEYERDAQAYIKERCFTPAGLREPDCSAKAHEAAREGQRKEQDLAAQNITAWWTKVMGIAALIGMALSAVGVWLIKTTFDETREANNIAREIGRAQTMAHLGVRSARMEIRQNRLFFFPNVANTGQTVAENVQGEFLATIDFSYRPSGQGDVFHQSASGKCKSFHIGLVNPSGEETTEDLNWGPWGSSNIDFAKLYELCGQKNSEISATIEGNLQWIDIFGERHEIYLWASCEKFIPAVAENNAILAGVAILQHRLRNSDTRLGTSENIA